MQFAAAKKNTKSPVASTGIPACVTQLGREPVPSYDTFLLYLSVLSPIRNAIRRGEKKYKISSGLYRNPRLRDAVGQGTCTKL